LSKEVKTGMALKIALAVVSILFITSLIANFYFYSRQYGISPDSGLESQVADLQSQVDSLTSDKNSLQNQVNSLTSERDSLKASKLVTRLGASDQKPWLATDYLKVSGSVWNVGTNAAYNCKLRVILYPGQTVAKDTYINLGTINGEAFADVDEKVYYEGSALTDWNITPEWE